MSEFIVTARRWRPFRFEDVVGQDHVTTTLRNAISTGRLAHAYLFSGPRGVGKTTTARLLAKAVNCLNPDNLNPDNTCELCVEVTEGQSFNVLEIDGASNRGVDEIRSLRESVRFPPSKGTYKVYIIDEVHMLTKEAFNALLKTLEEPPKHVLFIFATTEIHKVPPTILSRCQRFDFRRLSVDEMVGNLRIIADADGVTFEEDALRLVARKADGSLRDAQSLFDQVISLCGKTISHADIQRELRIVDYETFFRVTDVFSNRDAGEALQIIEDVIAQGYDLREFLEGIAEHLRNLLVIKATGSSRLIEAVDAVRERYVHDAGRFSLEDLLRLSRFVGATHAAIRWSNQPRFKLEADFVQMATLPAAENVASLIQRIDELKKKAPELPLAAGHSAPKPEIAPPTATPRAEKEREESEPAAGKIDPDQAGIAWGAVVREFRGTRISLGTAIEGTRVLAVSGPVVRVGCDTEFAVSSIKRCKLEIQEALQKRLHSRIQIEPVLDRQPAAERTVESGDVELPVDEHPVVRAMIRELGAEPL